MSSYLASSRQARRLIDLAGTVLDRDVGCEISQDNPELFRSNRSIQLAVFLATQMHLAELNEAGVVATLSLGLSLGEYSHLVHIGALDLASAIRLVDARGAAFDAGPGGSMACLFPTNEETVRGILREASQLGSVEISGYNSPNQFVVSGEKKAVAAAASIFEEREFSEAVLIETEIPMHSRMFGSVAKTLRPILEQTRWQKTSLPYVSNVTANPVENPDGAYISERLCEHVCEPVLWRQSIERAIQLCPDALFIEVGPGQVLTNLMRRSWVRVRKLATDKLGALAVAEAALQYQHEF
ncbi:MAG: ACP S-malonyltransferase [Alphaproteobacteria bacterium]|nr:ACP S-malonyltransferase [Alphaproteobacteria bacterium]